MDTPCHKLHPPVQPVSDSPTPTKTPHKLVSDDLELTHSNIAHRNAARPTGFFVLPADPPIIPPPFAGPWGYPPSEILLLLFVGS
jgi:hypothetical protein